MDVIWNEALYIHVLLDFLYALPSILLWLLSLLFISLFLVSSGCWASKLSWSSWLACFLGEPNKSNFNTDRYLWIPVSHVDHIETPKNVMEEYKWGWRFCRGYSGPEQSRQQDCFANTGLCEFFILHYHPNNRNWMYIYFNHGKHALLLHFLEHTWVHYFPRWIRYGSSKAMEGTTFLCYSL